MIAPPNPRAGFASPVVASYPLSALQEGMLFDALAASRRGLDIEQLVIDLDGTLDAERLRAAWEAVSLRHGVLRTAFRLTEDRPLQDVWERTSVPFTIEDVPLADAANRASYVEGCIAAERLHGFSMHVPPLQRVRLIRFGNDAQTLIWTNHHSILDGRARALVLRDIVDVYAGRRPAGDAMPFQDYISWLQDQNFAASELFWRERLRGFGAATPLPVGFAAAGDLHGGGNGCVERTLFGEDTARLLDVCRRHELTVNGLIQAAWALILSRHAGSSDVVFGAVRAGRRSGIDGSGAAGLMITTVPIRTNVDEANVVLPWLLAMRDQWNDLRRHEHVPYRTIAACSQVAPPQPLFDSIVMYERQTFETSLRTKIDPDRVLGARRARMYDQTGFGLTLAAAGTAEIELRLQYDPDRFGAADATRLLDQLGVILRDLPARLEGPISGIAMLSPGERERLVYGSNRVTSYPRDATVHTLFNGVAERNPNVVALQLGNETMTYAELGARSDSVARHLRERGAGPGTFVGIHLERSFDMIAGLLGVLKSGAASIALDPAYPPEVLASMLSAAGVKLILTQTALFESIRETIERMPAVPGIVCLKELPPLPFDVDAADEVRAEHAAHVMYTSGSTGLPKGAVIPHRAIVRTVRDTDYLRFAPDETFFAFVPLTFDVAILEVWGPLLNGARLVLCPPGLPPLDTLGATIESQGVTTLWLTTALFEQMVEEQLPRLRGLRQLIVGGDVMSPAHARRALEAIPNLRLLNVYGPTEATVLITAQRLVEPPDKPIPLGAPIPNATVYVLDPQLRPVPVGVPGEIYTGGDGLALGYLNAPELTAERFVPDPFAREPGAVMYRTGDLARWRDDGTVDFLGRTDQQIKIRGIRIELAAIESALTEHPGIREGVVVATTSPAGKRLVAYVVLREGVALTEQDVQTFLATRLARHSIPSRVIFVDTLPRTPTGKFARKALPPPSAAGERVSARRRFPESAAEISIAAHFAAVLGVDDIACDDDFYAFGGDSLRAMRLVSRLREAFGVPLSVRDLVAAPNVAALSGAIGALTRDESASGRSLLRTVRAGGNREPIFFLHGDLIGGGRYCDEIARRVDEAHPFYVLAPHGTDGGALPASIEAMAAENVATIRKHHLTGPLILGGFCNGGVVAYEMARQLERAGIPVSQLTMVDAFLFGPQPASLLGFIRREARRRLRGSGANEPLRTAHETANWGEWHSRLVEAWYAALARYVPRPYAGETALLWTEQMAARGEQLTQHWRRVAPRAIGRLGIPGTHLTSITRHLAQTSAILADAMVRGMRREGLQPE